ncbi:CHAP domain-containing protein [Leucobacter viscericola]|uniref:CHAP domain-containing protein n=1 Tax=Leucobacter viscericola TaxID=2714935 RepID=A0A6G7XEJ1_9MICO|nr:FG-GAP-like repeat-containing protein [Leucobacter viscericola]QIK63030.1 CHAP domain-containing protein [Leucobacter viscericola]
MSGFGRSVVTVALATALVSSLFVVPLGATTEAAAESPAILNSLNNDQDPGTGTEPSNVTQDPGAGDPEPTDPPVAPPTTEPTDPPTAEPTPPTTPAPEPTPEGDEPRGPNGGLASNSPGPASARPAEEAPDDQVLGGLSSRAMASELRGSIIGDNYPAKYRNLPWPYPNGAYIWDEWNFAYRQCTSFVAWRLNSANGVPFSNQYLGLTRWGDAGQWADSARAVGVRVDSTPEVGAVAWSGPWYKGASEFGHVAWVAQVLDSGQIVIEEYNNGWAGAYGTRTIWPGDFQGYIHIKDLANSFVKTTTPTISGAAVVGSKLTANLAGWTPAVTGLRYQWQRNGVAIAGATASTYTPTMTDRAQTITVAVTGSRAGYRAETKVSAATSAVLMIDSDGDGLDDTTEMLPWNSDVNGDGLPDVVGFGVDGVQVALNTKTGLGPMKQWVAGFGANNGWSPLRNPRTLVDVNGDGKSDVVGFANSGVYVATSTGSGFAAPKRWGEGFGVDLGWQVDKHPRTLADINGDGLPDIVGFGETGVYVALNTGSGFGPEQKWSNEFGATAGWRVDRHPRYLIDVNGDGKLDIVGFSNSGVSVALSTGKSFAAPKQWSTGFGYNSGWRMESHPRMLADVNGDGLPDVVGFKDDGVYAAINTGSGFKAPVRWSDNFGTAKGWQTGQHPRVLADVNGDGRADIVGFGESGVMVALSTGAKFGAGTWWSSEFGALNNGKPNWQLDRHPRMVTDVNGDGRADIVGFGNGGVRIAYNTGSKFAAATSPLNNLGYTAGGWRVDSHPRSMNIQTLSSRPVPGVTGSVRVGQQISGAAGSWQPRPVKLKMQWYRDGKVVSGATSTNYAITPDDLGTKLSFGVTGSKLGYAASQQRSKEFVVAPGVLQAPTPTIEGQLRAGSVLQTKVGNWGPAPVQLKYQWNRNGSPIQGATSASYKLSSADAGRRLTVTVTGSKAAYDTASRTSAHVKLKGAPPAPAKSPFIDVPVTHKFYRQIAWMHQTGLSTGTRTPQGAVYGPKTAVSREAMAAFLYRLDALKTWKPPAASPFIDVPANYGFYRQIAWMGETGLSTGTRTAAGARYDPKTPVSREAMAAFLYRLEAPKGYTPPKTSPFADVPTNHRFYREISWMYSSGLSTGTRQPHGKPVYSPKDPVSREAMAAFLYRMETNG